MKKMISLLIVACAALGASPVVAKTVDPTSFNSRSIIASGDYGWRDTGGNGTVTIKVNIATQMAYVLRGEDLIGITSVSTGRDGYETPQGNFNILWKEDNHWSKKYRADMPWTMWFTNTGVALHSGSIPGRPVSHGCVHLPDAFAKLLYQVVGKGVTVQIINDSPADDFDLDMSTVG